MSDHIQIAREGSVQIITMNRPDKKNALTLDMYAAMAQAIETGEADSQVLVQVITGGEDFSSGNDLNDFLTLTTLFGSPAERFLRAISGAAKPLLGAVNGAAIGIGSTMLLHCDMAIATPTARFQFPFINLALVPEAAATLLLPRLCGYQRAAELLMLGEAFDAETALRIGLIKSIVAPDALAAQILELAQKLAAKPIAALRQTKALLKAPPEPVEARIHREAELFGHFLQQPELKEAVSAFRERRLPKFNG